MVLFVADARDAAIGGAARIVRKRAIREAALFAQHQVESADKLLRVEVRARREVALRATLYRERSRLRVRGHP
jgi:hypothetical protein